MNMPDGIVIMFFPSRDKVNMMAVELIKCKYCKYRETITGLGAPYWLCAQDRSALKKVSPNDWCSLAKRREE